MSGTLKHTYAPTPTTTRGCGLHISADPKNEKFVYCSGTGVVIRNIRNPLIADVYTGHIKPVTVAKFAPSGFYIASGDVTGKVRIWDTTNIEHILKAEFQLLSGPVLDLAWSPDSQRIVVVGEGREAFGKVFMWDTGTSVGEIAGHSKRVLSCDFKQSRPFRVVTASEDQQVNYYEGPPFKFKTAIKDFSGRWANCVRFSPDGSKFVAVGGDSKLYVYDGKTAEKMTEFEGGHKGSIYSASWSADSTKLLTASADKTAKVWDMTTGEVVSTFTFSDAPTADDMQQSCLWAGDSMLTVSLNGNINILDSPTPRAIKGHNKSVTSVAYCKATNKIFSGSHDGRICVWEEGKGPLGSFQGAPHASTVSGLAVAGDKIISIGMDDVMRTSDMESGTFGMSEGFGGPMLDVSVCAGDATLAVCCTSKEVAVLRGGKKASTKTMDFVCTSVSVSPDGTIVAVGGKDCYVHLFTLSGNTLTHSTNLSHHRSGITRVRFSPDGLHLASADETKFIMVWDAQTKKPKIQDWVFHNARVTAMEWSPSGDRLVSGSLDCDVYVWTVSSPNGRVTINGAHTSGVTSVSFLDEHTIVTGGNDACLRTWIV
eukprot:TRINITY_DN21217_c0_g1_i1.p1 TRINITY_DN21217_c0_g1~~TRINITY_DN21217_c0_g1_i1.p1  ORF type:complete len:597 (-),score=119.83 TRINITY_DN21217_c0_g1_i1:105-1895(-)